MDDEDKASSKPKHKQIPLINELVFDESLPLKAPPRPRSMSTGIAKKQTESRVHGPEYDPDTRDLFGSTLSEATQSADDFRTGADRIVNDLVEEYSIEIIDRLRQELTTQLHSILDDLDVGAAGNDPVEDS